MEMQPVKSSNIAAVGHEGDELRIQFRNGKTYSFDDVPRGEYEELVNAESVGRAFNKAGFRGRGQKVLRQDYENLENGDLIVLHPQSNNPLHQKPVEAVFQSGYFYAKDRDPEDPSPDYSLRDIGQFLKGFEK